MKLAKNKIQVLTVAMLTGLLMNCGASQKTDKEPQEGNQQQTKPGDPADQDKDLFDTSESAEIDEFVEDTELAGQAVGVQVDSAISDVAEEATASSTGLNLFGGEKKGAMNRHRTCEADGDKAKVEITRSFERSWSFEGPVRSGSSTISHNDFRTRLWSKEGSAVECHESGKHAKVPVADMAGVNLEVTFSREHIREMTLKNLKKGIEIDRGHKRQAEGTRSVTWDAVDVGDDVVTIEKTVASDVSRKMQFKNKKGDLKVIDNNTKTSSEDPLKVVLERDATTLTAKTRTIKSGTVIATGKKGGRIETTFADVMWDVGAGCVAKSGTISGAIFKADSEEADLTFTIEFADGSAEIVFSNGDTAEYAPEGCDFEEPAKIVEKETREEVEAEEAEETDEAASEGAEDESGEAEVTE